MLRSTSSTRCFHHARRFLTQRCITTSSTVVVIDVHPHDVVVLQQPSSILSYGFVDVIFSPALKPKQMNCTIPFQVRHLNRHCRLLHTSNINTSDNTIQLNEQLPVSLSKDAKQQPMSYYERTVTFSNSIYKLYQDYLLYQNITYAYQTASNGRNLHAWAQRYRSLCEMSHQFQFHSHCNKNNHYHRHYDITVTESTVALIVQQQQRSTHQYAPNLIIPYHAQEQLHQFRDAIMKVTPTVLLCMIPIIGYVPMLLAILLPRQLLCYHFYNQYEILLYNHLQYQQRKQYFAIDGTLPTNIIQTYLRQILEKYQQQHEESILSSSSDMTSMDTIISFYRYCASMVDNDSTPKQNDVSTTTTATTTTSSRTHVYNILQLHTYPRDAFIQLALVTGMYSSTITNRTIQYYIIAYCTPTFVMRYYIRSLVKRILRDDQLLLCEEYLANLPSSSSNIVSSFIQTSMTDIELSNACLLRGLPTTTTTTMVPSTYHSSLNSDDPIRQSLTEHLNIVASLLQITHTLTLKTSSMSNVNDTGNHGPLSSTVTTISDQDMEQIGLFMLHLPLIRSCISKK